MFKKFLIISIVAGLFLPTLFCFGQIENDNLLNNIAGGSGYDTAGESVTSLSEKIGSYIQIVLAMLGVIFFVLTFYAGFLWLTAGGDEGKITKAKDIILAATIGLAIVILSYGITVFVVSATTKAAKPQGLIGD